MMKFFSLPHFLLHLNCLIVASTVGSSSIILFPCWHRKRISHQQQEDPCCSGDTTSTAAATTANCTGISCTSTLKPFQIRSTNVASCFVSHSIISDHDIPFVHFNISEFVLSLLGDCTTRNKIQ